jgi:hypothetical protein
MTSEEAYARYKRLYKQLNLLVEQSKGEDDDANHLRELMDPLWNAMTSTQQDEFRAMFVDQCK